MVQIDDLFPQARPAAVDLLAFFAFPPLQSVQTQEISILGLHNVLLCFVAPKTAELNEVRGVPHRIRDC
jgi:hypothetical protein